MTEKETIRKGSGLATAGLVLGIIGICTSFIPIINNASFFLGVLAIIFSITALVKKASRGKTVAALILGILSIIITLSLQDSWSKELDKVDKDLDNMTGENTNNILGKDVTVDLGKLEITTDEYGMNESKMEVIITNKTKKSASFDIQIEATDKDGNRITDDTVFVNSLGAGQTQKLKAFEYIDDDKVEAMKSATFKINKISKY